MSTTLAAVNLNRLVIFVAVVEAKSLTAAAARLGMAKTAVSAHMQRLEAELGASLLVRTTRKLSLTETGTHFYEAARAIVRDAEAAVQAAGHNAPELRGTLRVTAPVDYGALVVAPVLVKLRQQHPALKIDLLAGDRLFDLVAEGIDVAIRLGRLADSNLRAVRIGSFSSWLVAHPDLVPLKMPSQPEAFASFPFVALSVLPHPLTRRFEGPGKKVRTVQFKAVMVANTAYVMRALTLAGAGIAVMSDFAAADDVASGRLVRLLPEWKLPGGEVHVVFPATRYRSEKVQALIQTLTVHLGGVHGRAPLQVESRSHG